MGELEPGPLGSERDTMNKIQKRIQEAYAACYRLCESDRDACQWLERSLDAARRGEAQHRKAGARVTHGAPSYRLPIADAARFFAVKWFLEFGVAIPTDYAAACSLREDCLYARGAKDRMVGPKAHQWCDLAEQYADVSGLDYSEVFAA